jgi:hypothetical protein
VESGAQISAEKWIFHAAKKCLKRNEHIKGKSGKEHYRTDP